MMAAALEAGYALLPFIGREQEMDKLPDDLAIVLHEAVASGEYASPDAIIVAALRDWAGRRQSHAEALAALRAEIDKGLADLEAGNTVPLDAEDIKRRGRLRFAARFPSA